MKVNRFLFFGDIESVVEEYNEVDEVVG